MLTLKIDGIRAVQKMARDVAKSEVALRNRTKPLERIKKRQIRRWVQNFHSEGGEYGVWSPLRPWTMGSRQALGYGASGPKLVRTGALLGFFNKENQAGVVNAENISWLIQGDGSGGSYAVFHQTGYYNYLTGGFVPARKMWELDEKDADVVEEEMKRYVDQIIKQYYS